MQRISKNHLRLVAKLKQKKYRDQNGLYIISGLNAIKSSLNGKHSSIQEILILKQRLSLLNELNLKEKLLHTAPLFVLSDREFSQISDENTPQGIAVIAKKPELNIQTDPPQDREIIFLDRINDPGNLGTIIRTALWFNIKTILLSPDSADPFQPKVVRASTGYITHVNLYEEVRGQDLDNLNRSNQYSFVGTVVKGGKSLSDWKPEPSKKVILIFGSEAHGIDTSLLNLCSHKLTIPKPGEGESLNLATSVALFLYQIKIK